MPSRDLCKIHEGMFDKPEGMFDKPLIQLHIASVAELSTTEASLGMLYTELEVYMGVWIPRV